MPTFAECLAALPEFRNDLLRRQHSEPPLISLFSTAAVKGRLVADFAGVRTPRLKSFAAHGAYAAFATPLTNIHATGVGIRQKGGVYDPDDNVLKVFVFDKVRARITDIPKTTPEGIPVDVEYMPVQVIRAKRTGKKAPNKKSLEESKTETAMSAEATPEMAGVFPPGMPLPQDALPQRTRLRPIVAGLSLSPLNANFVGTLGCFLRRRNVGGTEEIFALSNNHVLANVNRFAAGTPIVQPGPEVPPFLTNESDTFATLHTAVPIEFPSGLENPPIFNRFDAAIASITNGNLILPGRIFGFPQPGLPNYNPSRVPTPIPGMRVMKMGRTTGFTRGRITATNVQGLQVNYGSPQFPRIAVFKGAIRIVGDNNQPFNLPGDSGSVILEEATGHPVALLFSGDGASASACDLGALCQLLGAWPI